MKLGLQGKTALVTGGAQGIGKAVVEALAAEGCYVAFTSRQDAPRAFVTDYSDHDLDTIFPKTIDILINNAGSTMGHGDPYGDYREHYLPVMDLNFGLAVRLCNKYLPGMAERGWGRVVNISSCSGMEQRGPVAFTAAKAALTAYTRSMGLLLAKESPGVVMTAVFPGVVYTEGGHWERVLKERPEHAKAYLKDQVPVGRFGLPAEIAPLVTFLASPAASFMHGALVPADGGLSKHFWNQVAP